MSTSRLSDFFFLFDKNTTAIIVSWCADYMYKNHNEW